jgi:hypothetical protein
VSRFPRKARKDFNYFHKPESSEKQVTLHSPPDLKKNNPANALRRFGNWKRDHSASGLQLGNTFFRFSLIK